MEIEPQKRQNPGQVQVTKANEEMLQPVCMCPHHHPVLAGHPRRPGSNATRYHQLPLPLPAPTTARTRTSIVFAYIRPPSPPPPAIALSLAKASAGAGAVGVTKRPTSACLFGGRFHRLTGSNKRRVEVIVGNYVSGTFFASLLGFGIRCNTKADAEAEKRRRRGGRNFVDSYESVSVRSSDKREVRSGREAGTDVIIVGAGVAGAALAHTLGKDGRQVHVIERDLTQADRIVGELLQPGGYLKLIELALEDCVEDIDSQKVLGYALFKDGRGTRLSYPLEKFHSDVAGRSCHNGRFIQRMREKASMLPNVRLEQGTVTSLLEENGTIKGVKYKTRTGQQLKAYAPLTVVCDGCFSNLRRALCNPKVDVPSCFIGLVLENCRLPFPNHGHVILADPSPILFYPISSTEIRCLVDVPGKKIPSIANGAMAKYLKTVVAPQILPELHDAFTAAIDKGNIRTMQNRSMPAAPCPIPGALLIGDAFNMRHPLTGGGMTVALSDIVVLRDLLKPLHDLNDSASLCRSLESFYTLRKPVSSTINTLAGALYKVFCASPDQERKELRKACFDYLSLGGVCSRGPMALLSGLNPSPLSLVLHFFAVAIYAVGRLLLPFPSFERLQIAARLLLVACSIIFPLIKVEGVRKTFLPATVPAYYIAALPVNWIMNSARQMSRWLWL